MPKWRANSEFGAGPRVPLCRERRAVWKAKLKLARKPGRLTLAAVEVGRTLLDMLGADGRLDPTIDLLARRAAVDPSTVVRALARLRDCGFLTWMRRLVRVRDTAGGWECRQTSNAYVLTVPACDTHFAKPKVSSVYKKVGSGQSSSTDLTDRESVENAARQLEAIGHPDLAAQRRASR